MALFWLDFKPVTAEPQIGNTWTINETSIPNGTSSIVKAVAVNGKIFVMSGSSNYEYNPITGKWTQKSPMPTPRDSAFGMTVFNGTIFVIGGYHVDGYMTSANEVYDPSTDTWETKTPMANTRVWVEVNAVNDKIYAIGGNIANHHRTNLTEVYDPATNSWTVKQAAPIGVIKGTSIVVDDKIYILGGLGDNQTLNAVSNQIYDTTTDSWSFGASLPTQMWNTAAGATTGIMAPKRIYVMGGGFTEILNTVSVYDPIFNNWTSGAPMPITRLSHAIVAVNDLFFVIGGFCSYEGPHPLGSPLAPGIRWNSTNSVDTYFPFDYGTVNDVSPTPTSSSLGSDWIQFLILSSVVVILATVIISALFYRRHRKTTSRG